jgi:DNA-binding NtrC family response regulator
VVSDIRLPKMDGMAFLREMLALDPELPVVLITGHGDVTMAVQAMKDGAYDFIQKPFPPEYWSRSCAGRWKSAGWCWRCATCAASCNSATCSKAS